jgi:hypothetical protein
MIFIVIMGTSISPFWTVYHSLLGPEVQLLSLQKLASPPDQLIKLPKTYDKLSLSGWYRQPAERRMKPVVCLYILSLSTRVCSIRQLMFVLKASIGIDVEFRQVRWCDGHTRL